MNIKLLKTTSGEEVICEVVSMDSNRLVIKNGLTMVWDGKNIQAIPFSVNCKDGVEINFNQDNMQFITEPREDMVVQYKKQFSPIITPESSIIT